MNRLIALNRLSLARPCSVCRRLLSRRASSCPACGAVPRWRQEPRHLRRAPIVLGVGVLAVLALALTTRPSAPARPATYARAEQLRDEKRVPTPHAASPQPSRHRQPGLERADAPRPQSAPASSGVGALAVVGVCLLASLALGSVALIVERRGRGDSTEAGGPSSSGHRDFFLRLGYAGAGACLGVAISVAIVLATMRLRSDGWVPGAVTSQPSPANAADITVPLARSQSPEGRDRPDHAVPAMAVHGTERPLRFVKRAEERPRDVPVNRARPSSPEAAPPPAPSATLTDTASIGQPPSEPEVSASPAFAAPSTATTELPLAGMPGVTTPAVEMASTQTPKAETPEAEIPKAEISKAEVPTAEMPKGYMSKTGTPKPETARIDPATLQQPQAPDRSRAAPDQNLLGKIRDDWKTVKGQARSDVEGIVHGLRHWLRRD